MRDTGPREGTFDGRWCLSWRADPAARVIADRHYNRQKVGAAQFVPPGRCLVLLTEDQDALWVTSWPFARYVKHDWPGAWMNSCFRRESGDIEASALIREAVAITRWYWPEPPDLGMVTFIDQREVKGTKVRGEIVYGYSYLKAGFKYVGKTKGGLLAFQMLPEDMPEPFVPLPRAGQLVVA
jgi:hypothetical protein